MHLFEFISIFTYGFSKLIKKKKNRWVFGAWFGNAVSDNTKAFYDYVAGEHPEIERIWVATDPAKVDLPGCRVIKRNSFSSIKYLLTAEVAVMNQGFGDLAAYNFLGRCYRVQLTHGVGWKKFARDTLKLKGKAGDKFYLKVFDLLNSYDLYVTPSEKQIDVMKSSLNATDSTVVRTGQPRNEVLFSAEYLKSCKDQLKKKYKIAEDKKLVVYMPTFRDNTDEVFTFSSDDIRSRLLDFEEKYGFTVLEKPHPVSFERMKSRIKSNTEGMIFVPTEPADVLLAAADILITDYSSCFFDYLITDRPVIHYLYDYEYYVGQDRGVYYDLNDVVAGDTPKTFDDLMKSLAANLENKDLNKALRAKRREEYITYESQDNSKQIFERIRSDLDNKRHR